jgi:hypothetical protein
MRAANTANEAVRQAESGQVWEEQLSGTGGTLILLPYQTFRVRAAAAVTVTIDGTLAMTMVSGEIEKFNSGNGQPVPINNEGINFVTPGFSAAYSCTIVITGTAFVQVARPKARQT